MNKVINFKGEDMIVLICVEYDVLIEDIYDGVLIDVVKVEFEGKVIMYVDLVMVVFDGVMYLLIVFCKVVGFFMVFLVEKVGLWVVIISDIENSKFDLRFSIVMVFVEVLNVDVGDIMEC